MKNVATNNNNNNGADVSAKVNKYQEMLNNSTDCIITIKGIDDAKTAEIFKTAKTAVWEVAKACYLLNKVQGIKLEVLEARFDVSKATIGKHAVNVAYLLEKFGKGFDAYADLYSVSKVDLIRKALDAGCYKGVKFEELIAKKRADIEKAIAKKDSNGDGDNTPEKTITIKMIAPDGEEIARNVPVDVWNKWVKEYKDDEEA